MTKKVMSVAEIQRLAEQGAEVQREPTELEMLIAGLREDLAAERAARIEDMAQMRALLAETVENIATSGKIDVAAIGEQIAKAVAQSMPTGAAPVVGLKVERDSNGRLSEIVPVRETTH